MKKVILCFVCIALLFSGCRKDIASELIRYGLEPEPDEDVDKITFRRGKEADGEILLTGDALEQVFFRTELPSYMQMIFIFTADGKDLLYQISSEFSESEEEISVWYGNLGLFCGNFPVPLNTYAIAIDNETPYFYQFNGIDTSIPSKATPYILEPETTPYILEPEEDYVLVDNITFRRGEQADGEIMFTGDALEKVSVRQDNNTGSSQLIFTFTDSGRNLLYQTSFELSKSGEKMSIWIGNKQITAANFSVPLTDSMVLEGSMTPEQVTTYFYQFYGIE